MIIVAILFPAVRRPNITSSRSERDLQFRDNTPVPVDEPRSAGTPGPADRPRPAPDRRNRGGAGRRDNPPHDVQRSSSRRKRRGRAEHRETAGAGSSSRAGSGSGAGSSSRAGSSSGSRPGSSSASEAKTCPVCRSPLAAGERIKSVVYRDGVQHGEITEYTTHVFGCPHCYPANRRNPRICPVCHGEVNSDGHLIARMFERPGRKKHVRVLGCTACRSNRRTKG